MRTGILFFFLLSSLFVLVFFAWFLHGQISPQDHARGGKQSGVQQHQRTPTVSGQGVETASSQNIYPHAHEFVAPRGFINTKSITLQQAREHNKLVLVHFWTYGCINCKRTLGHLNDWYDKYHADGLEIIGVHYPEFSYERRRENVVAFVQKNAIRYPIVLDNDGGTWRAYHNRYWPHRYLIMPDSSIIYEHIGEGAYDETEAKIREVLYNEG